MYKRRNDPRANSSYNATTFQLVAYTKRVSHAITNYYARIIKTINREWLDTFYLKNLPKK